MSTKIKTYKIIVDSKLFANIRGSTPAEVAKKAASKILGNSLNRARFSIQAKTGKIRHYDAKHENLVRPYHKNGKLVKYRIVVKKIGKQIGGTYPPNLEPGSKDPIFDFFPRGEYSIRIEDSTVNIYNQGNQDNQDNLCIKFGIENRELGIFELHHCGYKGSTNLKKIIDYAKKLNENSKIIDLIGLTDSSYFKQYKDIYLYILYILSTGISWYNYFKFISDNFVEEQNYNQHFLSINLEYFLNKCIGKIIETNLKYYQELNNRLRVLRERKQSQFRNSQLAKLEINKNEIERNGLDTIIERIRQELDRQKKIFIEKFGNPNIQELFTQIKTKLIESKLEEGELERIIELFKFINYSRIIMYDPKLKLQL
jgi:hypothetical protein